MSKGKIAVVLLLLVGRFAGQNIHAGQPITDANPMRIPQVSDYQLRILTPTLLELTLINTGATANDPTSITNWNFVNPNNNTFASPALSILAVTVNGLHDIVTSAGFKRRPIYAPLNEYDLRIGNYLYLTLAAPIHDNDLIQVANAAGNIWNSSVQFQAAADPARISPAIHVNQEGYMPNYIKRAEVGFYAGNLGELQLTNRSFNLINATNNQIVYTGALTVRRDQGYSTSKFNPLPYQDVLEADFSPFNTPGEYRIQVPGLGASYPFMISDGLAALFARTYELGLYHQRCGYSNELPYSRFHKDSCHTAPASVPTAAFVAQYPLVNSSLDALAGDWAHSYQQFDSPNIPPGLTSVDQSLFPFVNTNAVDTHGGHHDAGDYSKYTVDVAQLSHNLLFAVDSLPGVAQLDNLGVPESGDGIPDVLQEAMWEIDYLSRLQDADGGFYFLVYPRDRQYEADVSLVAPETGDPQVVFPKTTVSTAAAVGALAEAGSSPALKRYYPTNAAHYLAQAKAGWQFLMNAFAKYGREGCYQYINQYGDPYGHDDEMAWAAAALYAATGDTTYQTDLTTHFNPADPNTIWWSWWRMFDAYGCAIRDYAFAARSGRLSQSQLDPAYLAKCEQQIVLCGDDNVNWAGQDAYHNSFSAAYKQIDSAGWFFTVNQTFDLAVANVVSNKQAYIDTMIGNMNFEAGCNPINMTYLTGIGWRRQHQIVSQYADNEPRSLPPTGIPLGSVQQGFVSLWFYGSENSALTYPNDSGSSGPFYAPYDRWADTFNTRTELISPQQGRCLAAMAYLMAQTPEATQPWKFATATITNLPGTLPCGSTANVGISVPGVDMSQASFVWEATGQDPTPGAVFSLTPNTLGSNWIEVEATLPDGRRVFATNSFRAGAATNTPPNSYESAEVAGASDIVATYHLDNSWTDATGQQSPLVPAGLAAFDPDNVAWMANPSGASLYTMNLGDQSTGTIFHNSLWNAGTKKISVDAMIYVNAYVGYNKGNAEILALQQNWDSSLEFYENMYYGPHFRAGNTVDVNVPALTNALTPGKWHHLCLSIDQTGYAVEVDGATIYTYASADLANWSVSEDAKLTLGNFNGWIDEVVVRNSSSAPATNTPPQPVVATPTISPAGGTFTNSVAVTLACATPNATIHYTLDGSAPSPSSAVFSAPITVSASATVQALAVASAMSNSAVAAAAFSFQQSQSSGNWSDTDIGAVGPAGSATLSGGKFTVNGSGADIWGAQDAFNFVYQPWTGDGQIIARVAAVQLTDPWAKAGVMFRQSLDPGSPQVLAVVSAASGTALQYRASANDGAVNLGGGTATPPSWIKLVRAGNQFSAYGSSDGANWSSLGAVSVNMNIALYVGMAVCAHNNSLLCASTFDNVQLIGNGATSGTSGATNTTTGSTNTSSGPTNAPAPSALPAPWKHKDLGSVGLAGNSTYSGGVFTVVGSVADIWTAADAFHFAYQPWTGNGSIIAKVNGVGATDPWAKAGVMIRSALTANAAQALTVITPSSGATFQYRSVAGGYAAEANDVSGAAPQWVKISRVGNVFTGYISSNGTTWSKIGSQTIIMPKTIFFGLAVCSHNNTLANTSTFSSVKVSSKL